MKHLHPVAWLLFALACSSLIFGSTNWLLHLIVLVTVVAVAGARGGRRRGAFTIALSIGGLGFFAHLVVGALLRNAPENPHVLFLLPGWDIGPSSAETMITLGGAVSVEQLTASLGAGLAWWVACALIGLLWQACPAGQWCDLASDLFGRGAGVLLPICCLGEALVSVRSKKVRPDYLATVLHSERQIEQSWRARTKPAPPSAGRSTVAAVVLVSCIVAVGWAASLGSDATRTLWGVSVTVTPGWLAVIVALMWVVGRVLAGGQRLSDRLRRVDVVAIVLALAVVANRMIASYADAASIFHPALAAIPALPWALVAVVVVVAGMWIMLGRIVASQPAGVN